MKLGRLFCGACSSAVVIAAAWSADARGAEIRVASALLSLAEAVDVPAPDAGLLRDVTVREGSTVSADQVIATVDPREHRFAADLIRHDLRLARRESQSDIRVRLAAKEHSVAVAELARAESVNAALPNTVSEKEIDRLRLAAERTDLAIENTRFEQELLGLKIARIEADLRLAEHRVDRLAVAAPIGGVVAEMHRHAGEWVDRGEKVARVARVDRLRVEGYVDVRDALDGLVGRPVTIEASLPDGVVGRSAGTVVFVSPEAEPINAQVRFWAEIDNRDLRLRPGLTATVVIGERPAELAERSPK